MGQITSMLDQVLTWHDRLKHPIASFLRPGLSYDEIFTQTQHLPFELPDEIYELYMWRNGVRDDEDNLDDASVCGSFFHPGLAMLSLEDAIAIRQVQLADHEDRRVSNLDFPLFSNYGGTEFLIRCGTCRQTEGVILNFDYEWPSDIPLPVVFSSLKDMLKTHLAFFEEGAYYIEDGYLSERFEKAIEIARRLNPHIQYWFEVA